MKNENQNAVMEVSTQKRVLFSVTANGKTKINTTKQSTKTNK